MIEEMKIAGFPIRYDKKVKTYFYEKHVELKYDLSITLLKDDERIQIFGGNAKKIGKKYSNCKVVAV